MPLVEAREEHPVTFHVDERPEQLQPGVALPHLLPEVCRLVTRRDRRVARAAGVASAAAALVEREEDGVLPGHAGRHRHPVRVDGEVDQRAPAEDEVVRVAVGAVLRDRVLDGLLGERVLELGGRDRDAVDDQDEVERVAGVGLGVVQLPHDAEAVGGIPLALVVVESTRRLEGAQPHGDPGVLHGSAQHADRAAMVERRDDGVEELLPRGRLPAVAGDELPPRLGLGGLDEGDDLVAENAFRAVVCRGVQALPPVAEQAALDIALERRLARDGHPLILPVSWSAGERGSAPVASKMFRGSRCRTGCWSGSRGSPSQRTMYRFLPEARNCIDGVIGARGRELLVWIFLEEVTGTSCGKVSSAPEVIAIIESPTR